jgi:hypothetical protein
MAFTSPSPQISQISASVVKRVTAVGSGGPTDAGSCHAWWEVELVTGTTAVVVRANKSFPNDFVTVRSRTDIFTVPSGQNWDGKRIRFVIQAHADPTQVWYSAWGALAGSGFDNSTAISAVTDTTAATSTLTTVAAQQLRKAKKEQDRKRKVKVSSRSRLKMAKAFIDGDKSGYFSNRGVVFGLMPKLDDFFTLGDEYQTYRLTQADIGFLDHLMTKFHGLGNEDLWWSVAYANAVVDPETDLESGDVVVVPSDALVSSWLTRSPTPTRRSV